MAHALLFPSILHIAERRSPTTCDTVAVTTPLPRPTGWENLRRMREIFGDLASVVGA
jgi:hypothetical protein